MPGIPGICYLRSGVKFIHPDSSPFKNWSHMFKTTSYRYPNEILILAVTLILVGIVFVVAAVATFCLVGLFVLVILGIAIYSNYVHHQTLMRQAYQVRMDNLPELASVATTAAKRLQPGPVEIYLVKSKTLNAYTFGLSEPKVIVIYDSLLQVMDKNEMAFIIGHEMGHIALSHTWLNTLLGGMGGVPMPFGAAVILNFAFLSWNRNCEFSSDRAGLLACGNLNASITALVKLVAPNTRNIADFERAMTMIDAQDDHMLHQLGELFQSHPMIIRRINQLRDYAASTEYKRLQAAVDQNLRA